jgi:hypothetical protein
MLSEINYKYFQFKKWQIIWNGGLNNWIEQNIQEFEYKLFSTNQEGGRSWQKNGHSIA